MIVYFILYIKFFFLDKLKLKKKEKIEKNKCDKKNDLKNNKS